MSRNDLQQGPNKSQRPRFQLAGREAGVRSPRSAISRDEPR